MKKRLLVMISALCLMTSSAFATISPNHFEEETTQPATLNQTLPACQPGQVLTYNGMAFSCTSNVKIACPAGQALNGEDSSGTQTCVTISCPAGEVLSSSGAVPACIPTPTNICPSGQVLTFNGNTSATPYTCEYSAVSSCPSGEAFNGQDNAGNPICIQMTCPAGTGQTLNYPVSGGPPNCIVPPACPAGQVLNMTGTTGTSYGCTSAVQTIACAANTALVYIDALGNPTCIAVPSAGSCPAGTAMSSINIGGVPPTCVSVPGSGGCPAGTVLSSINGNGVAPTCVPAAAPGTCPAGMIVDTSNAVNGAPACVNAAAPATCPSGFVLQSIQSVGSAAPNSGCVIAAYSGDCPTGQYVIGLNGPFPPDCGTPTCP